MIGDEKNKQGKTSKNIQQQGDDYKYNDFMIKLRLV